MFVTRIICAATIVAGSGCSSFDFEVLASLREGGEIHVDPTAPDELAVFDINVDLESGRYAGGPVRVDQLVLYEGETLGMEAASIPTELAVPVSLSGGEIRTVGLNNVGARNVDLEPHCGRLLRGMPWRETGDRRSTGGGAALVQIRCP